MRGQFRIRFHGPGLTADEILQADLILSATSLVPVKHAGLLPLPQEFRDEMGRVLSRLSYASTNRPRARNIRTFTVFTFNPNTWPISSTVKPDTSFITSMLRSISPNSPSN